jgi:hypothetical protein
MDALEEAQSELGANDRDENRDQPAGGPACP